MVYGVAFCPASYVEKLDDVGFDGAAALSLAMERLCSLNSRADSKALTAATRTKLLQALDTDPTNLGWAVRVLRCVHFIVPNDRTLHRV